MLTIGCHLSDRDGYLGMAKAAAVSYTHLDVYKRQASSTAIGLARTRSMLHVCGEVAPTSSETRRLVMAYLSAGDQA